MRLAAGADVLVHEVIDVDALTQRITRLPNYEAVRNHLASSHTAPEQVGEIADAAGVGTLVLSHLVPGDVEISEQEWEARVRPHFDGEVVCGVDLDEFALDASRRHGNESRNPLVVSGFLASIGKISGVRAVSAARTWLATQAGRRVTSS